MYLKMHNGMYGSVFNRELKYYAMLWEASYLVLFLLYYWASLGLYTEGLGGSNV
jgi:hypothetical protein